MPPARRFDAVIFDMDGTLIEPLLDFQAIRTDLGIPPGQGILEALDGLSANDREDGHRRLLGHELAAAREARLMPNAVEALAMVRAAGLKTALLTRNAAEAMRIVLDRFPQLAFDLAWSREDGPIKPEPDGVLRACVRLGAVPERTACVGDFRYDIVAAKEAGAVAVLLAPGEPPDFASEADCVIADLLDLRSVLGL